MSSDQLFNVDISAERAVLAGVIKYGLRLHTEISEYVNVNTFYEPSNAIIWKCSDYVIKQTNSELLDYPSIVSAANALGYGDYFGKAYEQKHLQAIMRFPVEYNGAMSLAYRIKRLHIARLITSELNSCIAHVQETSGDEPLSHLLGMVENPIINLTAAINCSDSKGPELIFSDGREYLEYLKKNVRDSVGISTGFPIYDRWIGGGIRPGGVSFIGARIKTGKSVLAGNIGRNVAGQGVPVLYLDTEMKKVEHQARMWAMLSGVSINDIETGQFSLSREKCAKVEKAQEQFENLKFSYLSVCGRSFEDIIGDARRWVRNTVGLEANGHAKPCLIILDYLKLMDDASLKGNRNLAETQLLGFVTTTLVNFSNKFNIPTLSFGQLNRDGISVEDSSALAASDRISWFSSNISILKKQSVEEMSAQPRGHGTVLYNRKLKPVVTRHGPDFAEDDYINVNFEGHIARMTEGPLQTALMEERSIIDNGGEVMDEESDRVPF